MKTKAALGRFNRPYLFTIVVITIVICIGLVVYGVTVVKRLQEAEQQWYAYSDKAASRSDALRRIHKHFGYGGFIHNFKSFVMRKDASRIPLLDRNLSEVRSAIRDYRMLALSENEQKALKLFESTVFVYADRFELAKQLIANDVDVRVVDQLVEASDSDGQVAIDALNIQVDAFVAESERLTSLAISETVKLISYGVLLIPVILAGSGFILFLSGRAERSRRDTGEARLMEALAANMTEGVIISNDKGGIVKVNKAACKMFQYEPHEMHQLKIEDLVPEKFKELHANNRRKSIQMNQSRDLGQDLLAITKDRKEIDVLISISFTEQQGQRYSVAVIRDISKRKKMEEKLRSQRDHLELLSRQDGLTGISNRRHFDEVFPLEWYRARRSCQWLSVIILDIDCFKAYNDHYGHLDGDECLKSVVGLLKRNIQRSGDFIARFGGEEFACILPGTDHEQAMVMAEMLRNGVEASGIPHEGLGAGKVVTISLGVASVQPAHGIEGHQLIEAADVALYKSKSEGRNRVSSDEMAFPKRAKLLN